MAAKDYKPTKYFRTPASEGGKILVAILRKIKNRKKMGGKKKSTFTELLTNYAKKTGNPRDKKKP